MTNPTSQALLEERYGRSRSRSFDKRFAWIIGGVLVLAGLVFVFFGGWQQGTNIDFQELHYTVVDDSRVEIDIQVTAPPKATVICALEALSTSHGTVGWKIITVPESNERTRRFTGTLVTTAPATTGLVRDCWELTKA